MARAVYQHELNDPDFSWLMNSFHQSHPEFVFIDSVSLPAVFIRGDGELGPETTLFPADSQTPRTFHQP